MQNSIRHFGLFAAVVLTVFFTLSCGKCFAYHDSDSENTEEIIPGKVVLSENAYHTTIKLAGYNGQDSTVDVKRYDGEGKLIGIDRYAPADEIRVKFEEIDDLDSAVVSWTKKDNTPFCEPVTLEFDMIYAEDWQDLATAIHRMDQMYAGKVEVEDDSKEYSSGRLIVKTKEELPDVSEFNVSMTVVDDENHYYMQFEKSSDAKKCSDFLKQIPEIEYVDIDSVVFALNS